MLTLDFIGDAMLILAYQYFEQYEPAVFMRLAKLFSKKRH
jgi:geranylgeranyl diphosphate synthase type II